MLQCKSIGGIGGGGLMTLPGNTTRSKRSLPGEGVAGSGLPCMRLAGYVSASQAERRISESEEDFSNSHLSYVDLTDAVQFDVVALLHLLATVARRREAGQQTKFRLPDDALARHVLRLWQFPRAVSVVTLAPFRLLVDTDDWVYFGERWPTPRVEVADVSPSASVLAYLIERQYFGLSPYGIKSGRRLDRIVESEVNHWGSYALSNLLAKVLDGPATDIARVVVQELVTNAMEYTSARLAVVASHLDLFRHAGSDAPAGLTVAVWDDGPSIVEALRSHLASGQSLHPETAQPTDEIAFELIGGTASNAKYTPRWTPEATSSDSDLLLAHVISALTRRASEASDPRVGEYVPGNAGYSFSALIRSAVDTFQGSVEIRAKGSAVRIDRQHTSGAYRLHVATGLARLTGDMMTVRLPASNG
jgi:hypothetical protein